MDKEKHPELEIDADLRQQRYEWVMERIAWAVMTVLLLGIACGLFGRGGPLSTRDAASPDGLVRIEYERFVRYHSPDELRLKINADSDVVRVEFSGEYIQHIQIDRITPQPERELSENGDVTFVFGSRPGTQVHAVFAFTPQKLGGLDGWASVSNGVRLPFSQFVYP